MHGVAAEIAQKITVFFQDNNPDPGAGKKKSVNHAGGTTTGNTNLGKSAPASKRTSRSQPYSVAEPITVIKVRSFVHVIILDVPPGVHYTVVCV